MAGGLRWLFVVMVGIIFGVAPLLAQGKTPSPAKTTAVPMAEDAARLLEAGKGLMGKNNPTYATISTKVTPEERNGAGVEARATFHRLVRQYPQYAEGWLWLGIALTETLHFSKTHPEGEANATEAEITEGLQAFKTAYERNPADLICVSYYGEALMTYRKDFAAACKLWEDYAAVATTDLQRVIANVQAARASLNLAYFGKAEKMPEEEVKAHYQQAVSFVEKAAKLCPNAQDVKEMQALLKQYRKTLLGK